MKINVRNWLVLFWPNRSKSEPPQESILDVSENITKQLLSTDRKMLECLYIQW